MPHEFCRILFNVLRDFVDGTSLTLLIRNSHKEVELLAREHRTREVHKDIPTNMSETVSVIRRQSLTIDSQFYPPTDTIPQTGRYSTGWYGHVCEDYNQKIVLNFFGQKVQ